MGGYLLLLVFLLMPATVSHALSMTTPDDPAYENKPSNWNNTHAVTLSVSATEISGLFSNANGVSFGLSNSSITASHNALTTAMASNRGSDFVQATAAFAGTSASGTIASGGISVSVGPYITTADLSANSSKYIQEWALLGANTAGTTSSAQGTRLQLSAGNSLTLSGNSNTIVLSVGPYITTADLSANSSKYVQNWKLTGNTSGTTSSAQGTDLWLSGGNSITVSGSSNSIVFSVGNYITTAMASNRGTDFVQATAAFAGTNASGTINSTGISVSVAAAGGGTTISSYANMADGLQNIQTQQVSQSTSVAVAFQLPQAGSFSFLRIPIALSAGTTALTSSAASANASGERYSTWNAVVYSMGTGASSKSLMSEASGSVGQTFRNSVSIAANGSQYSITQALSFNAEGGQTTTSTQYSASSSVLPLSSTFFSAAFSGSKWLDINFANSLQAGPKWLIFGLSTSSATNSTRLSDITNCFCRYATHYCASMVASWWGVMGSTDHTSGGFLGMGSFTTGGAAGTTANLPISAISSSASNNIPYFQLLRSA